MSLCLQEHLSCPGNDDLLVCSREGLHPGYHSRVSGPGVDPPFRVDALERGVVVFGLEFGCHGWREDSSWFDRRLGRDLDDLNGEVMADMDDATGQWVALGTMSCLEAGDLGSDVGEGGRRERVGVGVHGIHVGVALVQEGVTTDGKGSAEVEWHGGVAKRSVTRERESESRCDELGGETKE